MKRILIVDDEPILLETVARCLEEEGFYVIKAGDGLKALQKIEEEGLPDLIVTDWIMPIMGGSELISAIMVMPDPPLVIVVSGGASNATKQPEHALQMGAKEVIIKPISGFVLARKIKALLEA